MPSFLHEILVKLFRQRPLLAPELLLACAELELPAGTAHGGSIDLTQVVPAQYRSDALTVLRDEDGGALAAVIVEVQLAADEDKRLTWPLYLAAARAEHRCPAFLLVLAPDPAVARWARRAIELGHPAFALSPLVLDYPEIPLVLDASAARAAPELAVLSAMAHPSLETAVAAGAALRVVPEELQKLYWDSIWAGLPAPVRRALEARMIEGYDENDPTDIVHRFVAIGHEKGYEEGLRSAILALVGARFPALRGELEAQLRALHEPRLLELLPALGDARDEASVRALLVPRAT